MSLPGPIKKAIVVGGGSAGLMAALALRRVFPHWQLTVIESPDVPTIGVGESTTVLFPPFLHQTLGLDFKEFFQQVGASWKLGVRFLWGDPAVSHFNYPFDSAVSLRQPSLPRMPAYYCLRDATDASRCCALMDQGKSPVFGLPDGQFSIDDAYGYHLDNVSLIAYLRSKSLQSGMEFISGHVAAVNRQDAEHVDSLTLSDGRRQVADLFIDASGFGAQLLGNALQQPFVSYSNVLRCDRAVIGRWERDEPIQPYTTVETMDCGWCWRIDFPRHVSRGYVYASDFCSDDQAIAEMRRRNPELKDDLRLIAFRTGRRENFWVGNVVAIGNSSGFAEPMEATALHLAIEQIRLLCRVLTENEGRCDPALTRVANRRFRLLWDEVRDFLAVHYRFNRWSDTEFWQWCRAETDLGAATEFVDLYQRVGPSSLCATTLPGGHVFGFDGFISLLIGQRVPTSYEPTFSEGEWQLWRRHCQQNRQATSSALPMREAFRQLGVL